MKRLADQIKQALSALAMADVGEVSGRYRMEAALNPSPTLPAPTPAGQPRKLIALGVGEALPAAVVDYVAGVCRRMGADLLILTTDASRLRGLVAEHLPTLRGIAIEAEELGAASRRAVLAALERRSGLLFAVSGGPDDPVRCLVEGRRGLLARNTPVPVVVVGEREPARKAPARPRRTKPSPPLSPASPSFSQP